MALIFGLLIPLLGTMLGAAFVFLIDCQTGEIMVHDAHPDLDSILSDLLP